MKPHLTAVLALTLFFTPSLTHALEPPIENVSWTPLFDGKTLKGWKQLGGKAKYTVKGDQIVGTSVPNTPNSFLATTKHYGDFILEYEYKVDPQLNSGVQIRSHAIKSYNRGRVHGYQIEIDENDKRARFWSAGIYEEGRRGWQDPYPGEKERAKQFSAQGKKLYRKNQWNKVRVVAIGDRIQTWLNGQPRGDLRDAMTLSGFIALQVHGVGKRKDPLTVAWRNLRIKDLGKRKWIPLFDGKTLNGWHPAPGGKWQVKDGIILGTSPASDRRHGQLISNKTYDNFTVRILYRATKGNSGLYFRVDKVKSAVAVHGFQAEIDPNNDAGGLYETGGRGWVVKPNPKNVKRWYKPNQWNQMTVAAYGKHIVVRVNGFKTAELKNDPGRLKGHIALQLHGSQDMHIEFKKVEILGPAVH